MVAAGNAAETGAHGLSLAHGSEHLAHQVVHLVLGKGGKARGMGAVGVALAHLLVIIVTDAVGLAAGAVGDVLEYGFERQALVLGFLGGFPQQFFFGVAPAHAVAGAVGDHFHMHTSVYIAV